MSSGNNRLNNHRAPQPAPQPAPIAQGAPKVQAQIVITLLEGGQLNLQWPDQNKPLCRQMLNAARDLVEDYRKPQEAIEVATPETAKLLGVG